MDRIRVGLTGLGVVFLITLGAAFAFSPAGERASPENKPGEPLAQLGVAPGAEKSEPVPAAPEVPETVDPSAEGSGTTMVPPPQNAPVAGDLMLPAGGGTSPSVHI